MRLRLIGIRFSGLVRGTYQINMFEDTEKMSLYQAMDRMKKRYGFDAVARCAGATLKVKANNVHQLSLLSQPRYGTIPLNELVQQAASCGVEAILTDINTVTGIYDFIKECKAAIKPLVGIEFRYNNKLLYIGLAKTQQALRK
jgi:hypothetical protein